VILKERWAKLAGLPINEQKEFGDLTVGDILNKAIEMGPAAFSDMPLAVSEFQGDWRIGHDGEPIAMGSLSPTQEELSNIEIPITNVIETAYDRLGQMGLDDTILMGELSEMFDDGEIDFDFEKFMSRMTDSLEDYIEGELPNIHGMSQEFQQYAKSQQKKDLEPGKGEKRYVVDAQVIVFDESGENVNLEKSKFGIIDTQTGKKTRFSGDALPFRLPSSAGAIEIASIAPKKLPGKSGNWPSNIIATVGGKEFRLQMK